MRKYKIGYTFDKLSGRFIGSEKVYEEIITGNYPCADNVVFEAPPECRENEYSRWDGKTWEKHIEEGFIEENGIIREMTPIERIESGIDKLPEGMKIENNEIIPMTPVERIENGLDELPEDMKIENGKIIPKSIDDYYKEGKITVAEYNAEIDRIREAEYQKHTDKIGLMVLRGEKTMNEWISAMEKIRTKYPKKDEE